MRVSEYGKQWLRPRDFWTAVLLVATVIVGVGLSSIGTGRLPKIAYTIGAVLVALGWAANVWILMCRGRKNFSRLYLLFVVGYTLFCGEHIIPYLTASKMGRNSVMSLIGGLLMLPSVLAAFVDFGKRPAPGTSLS